MTAWPQWVLRPKGCVVHNLSGREGFVAPLLHNRPVSRSHGSRRALAAAGLAVAAILAGRELLAGPHPAAAVDPGAVESPALPPGAFAARGVRVVGGDTLLATPAGGSGVVRVRVIGIDTPETVKPGSPVACYGPQASAFTKHLLPPGSVVRAAHEPGGDVDRYGRQLWDVWLPDGRFLESVLAAAGAARAYPYPPQVQHAEVIARIAAQARVQRRGLWGSPCDGKSFGDNALSG